MELTVKDIRFEFDQQTIFCNVVIGSRAAAASALMSADDLEKIGKIFLGQAALLRGD